ICIPGTGSQCTRGRTTLKSRAPAAVKMNAAAIPAAGAFDFNKNIFLLRRASRPRYYRPVPPALGRIISGGALLWPRAAGAADQLDAANGPSHQTHHDPKANDELA